MKRPFEWIILDWNSSLMGISRFGHHNFVSGARHRQGLPTRSPREVLLSAHPQDRTRDWEEQYCSHISPAQICEMSRSSATFG